MDSLKYDQFGHSEINSNHRGNIFPQKCIQTKVGYLLYGVLVLLLLILLFITGIKFSQLSEEIVDVHRYLEGIMRASATSSSSSSGTCSEDWVSFQGSCYLLSKTKLSWDNAEETCIRLGAHLLVLNTEQEMDYISKVSEEGQRYWIGLVERTQEGHWTWVDGTDYRSTPNFWDKGQPDNWDVRVNGEDCGELHPGPRTRRRLWNDSDCTLQSLYICEAKEQ
ncbi:CD209 antigen-like protein C isoform X2 [Esox lucius]|uniref:C-type lectin domain-containing protein n=1 Tax=Esox lucius TaxID=8010 RepID=A0AAY5KFM0_ESOLU|nr:CD209 antigen-like protein C isoform X2 [Esox lucius]